MKKLAGFPAKKENWEIARKLQEADKSALLAAAWKGKSYCIFCENHANSQFCMTFFQNGCDLTRILTRASKRYILLDRKRTCSVLTNRAPM